MRFNGANIIRLTFLKVLLKNFYRRIADSLVLGVYEVLFV